MSFSASRFSSGHSGNLVTYAQAQLRYEHVYIGSDAKAEVSKVDHLISALFDYFCQHIEELPPELKRNPRGEPNERLVVDYTAGVTDRFAISTFERIFVPRSWSI